MQPQDLQLLRAKTVVKRLARLSADSIWARRASGLRASIDKIVHQIEAGSSVDHDHFDDLITMGFTMLERAAEEIPVPEDILLKSRKNF